MKRSFLFLMMLMFVAHEHAFAQYMPQQQQQYGSGIWPGQQGCQMENGPAPGASDESDETDAIKKRLAMQKKKKTELDRKLSRLKSDSVKAKRAVDKRLNPDVSSQIFEHLDRPDLSANSYSCNAASAGSTQTNPNPGDGTQGASGSPAQIPLSQETFCKDGTNLWARYALAGGQVRDSICDVRGWTRGGDSFDCKSGIQDYVEAKREMEEVREELNGVKGEIKALERELADTRARIAELKESEETEGGYCATCNMARRGGYRPSGWQVAAGLLTAAAGGALGYFGGKYAVDQNAKLGWPTSPYWVAGMAYPMVAAGIYGAVGGGVMGGVGCGGTFGPGGGMYGGMPGAFGAAPGLYGGMGGMPMGGMMGYPGMMAMGGGIAIGMPAMGGYPGMMAMGGGIAMAGYPGMMAMGGYPYMGMPAMGGMMGYPGMMAMGGGIAMGMPGMLPYPGMMAMGGAMAMGGYPGMMAMGGAMAMGMPAMGGMGMQNMMMQQYYMQMQQQMAYQQQAMSDYMQRMQTVGYLSNEMARLQQQIMMISTGMGGSYSVLPYPGYSGGYGGGYGTPPPTIPYPGTTGTPYTGVAAPIR